MPTAPKNEPAEANRTRPSPPAAPPVEAAAEVRPASSGRRIVAWLPAIAALLLAPVATWATVEFVLLPRWQRTLAAKPEAPPPAAAAHNEKPRDPKAKDQGAGYEFQNVVVNLAGTAGTRYLKASFLVTGADPNLRSAFEGGRPRLMDVTLNVLSSLTLPDLEEPGARNIIREKLVAAYNQVLGRKVADQVYFSDFVVQ